MTYMTNNKTRKYVQGYGFLSFANKYGKKLGKKTMDVVASKIVQDIGKKFISIAGKKVINKTAEATVDLIGNKIADKIPTMGKNDNREVKTTNDNNDKIVDQQTGEMYISPEKRAEIIEKLHLF